MSEKRRKKKLNKVRVIRNIVITVVILGLITVGIIFLRKMISDKYATDSTAELISVQAQSGSISTTVYGSGRLADDDVETVKIPDSVEIDEVRVSVGDTVTEGDVLATVDSKSVISAMSVVQSEIDAMDAKLEEAGDDEIESQVKAPVSGRVKEIYVAEGDGVTTVMSDKNALMVISADGYMAVDLSGSSLAEGDEVTVKTSDGTEYTGSVKYVSGQNATVIFSDEGPKAEEKESGETENPEGTGTSESPEGSGSQGKTGGSGSSGFPGGSGSEGRSGGSGSSGFSGGSGSSGFPSGSGSSSLPGSFSGGSGTDSSVSMPEITTGKDSSSKETVYAVEEVSVIGITPTDTVDITVTVDELDITNIAVGQSCEVTFDAISAKSYEGNVRTIDTTGENDGGNTKYTVTVTVKREENMYTGMNTHITFSYGGKDDAKVIPERALYEEGGKTYVYTGYDNEKDELTGKTEVTTGLADGENVEILSGLSEDDKVYYRYADSLTINQAVR